MRSPLIDLGLDEALLVRVAKGEMPVELMRVIATMREDLGTAPVGPLPRFRDMDPVAVASVLHNLLEFDDLMIRQLEGLPPPSRPDYSRFMQALRIELLRLLFVPPHTLDITKYMEPET